MDQKQPRCLHILKQSDAAQQRLVFGRERLQLPCHEILVPQRKSRPIPRSQSPEYIQSQSLTFAMSPSGVTLFRPLDSPSSQPQSPHAPHPCSLVLSLPFALSCSLWLFRSLAGRRSDAQPRLLSLHPSSSRNTSPLAQYPSHHSNPNRNPHPCSIPVIPVSISHSPPLSLSLGCHLIALGPWFSTSPHSCTRHNKSDHVRRFFNDGSVTSIREVHH